jgi:8-oxo-dGTP pyrophosphatase MutT (NUDIX family)
MHGSYFTWIAAWARCSCGTINQIQGHISVEFHITEEQNLFEHVIPQAIALPRHFTASAVVMVAEHILLVHHKRIGAWLPPGGHLLDSELPHEAAARETLEETGVAVRALSLGPMPQTGDVDAFFLPQPLCIQVVRALEKGTDLYHLDIAYLCAPVDADGSVLQRGELPPLVQTDEVHGARWFALSALSTTPLAKNVPEIVTLALSRQAR